MARIQGVLIDLSGVLYVGDAPVPGAAEALERLRGSALPVRFLTNTTRQTREALLRQLGGLGFAMEAGELFTAPMAALSLVRARGLRPHLLVHPGLLPEFQGIDSRDPNAVILGDAGDAFTYDALNQAFRLLTDGAPLIAMGRNRYFKETDGLSLDIGPFVAALEFAAGVEAEITGKPAAAFFETALADMGLAPEQAVMIGDDLPADIGGAQALGLRGVLVRTGKYQPEDERDPEIRPDHIADDLADAVEWILSQT